MTRTANTPSPSQMPGFYLPPLGLPVYWRNEVSGVLPAAVKKFFDNCLGHCPDETAADLGLSPLTPAEVQLLAEYLVYFISAPCWDRNPWQTEQGRSALLELRVRSKTLGSVEAIRRWLEEAMDIGLDPF